MTSERPLDPTTSGSTAADTSTQAAGTKKPGLKQRFAGKRLGGAIGQVGLTLTNKEAKAISRQTGRSVAEVMSTAMDRGVTLGANLINKFNAGKLGPNLDSLIPVIGKYSVAPGQSKGAQRALQNLMPLQGVSMPAGSVYAGSTAVTTPGKQHHDPLGGSSTTPARTTFQPVVLPKAVLRGAMTPVQNDLGYAAPTQSGTAGATPATQSTSARSQQPKRTPAKQAKARAQKAIAKRQAGSKTPRGRS